MERTENYTVPELHPPLEYHVFITHCEEDFDFAKGLLESLESKGISCLFAKRDFLPGTSVVENIASAITKCRRIVMVISRASLRSDWCNFELLVACNDDNIKNRINIIPVLTGVIKGCELPCPLQYLTWVHAEEEPEFYFQRLIKVISAADETWTSRLPAGNVAHGLAWSYYFGYLRLVLPDVHKRIMQCKFWNKSHKNRNMCKKMIFLFPQSCRCYNTLAEEDPNIKFEENLKPVKRDRAGTVGRTYSHTVYSIKDGNKKYYFVGEYITAIHTMYEMEASGMAGLSTWYKYLQASYFYLTLMDILKNDIRCMNKCRILNYKDDEMEPKSNLILKTIKQEITQELNQESQEQQIQRALPDDKITEIDGGLSLETSDLTNDSGSFTDDSSSFSDAEGATSEIINCFSNFLLFDTPEAEPVIIRDENGKAKSIERGECVTNLLTSSCT